MFIAGRVIIGSALAFSTTVAPIIAQEYAHPRMRGTVATTYNTVYYVGAIAISWVGFGTSYMGSNSWSWR
jgi:MFS family permease